MKNFLLVIVCIVSASCYKRYIGTRIICKNLYVEIFDIDFLGGNDACYLTDSMSFRVLVGKFDPESGNYRFHCVGNNIYLQKYIHRNSYISDTVNIVTEKRVFDLAKLKKEGKFEN